ncbi:olfactory receptor 5AP2-like [Pelobates fuscus]|uniref:olfactory receptor 5AP2-like n=1 Tax=Pelobates fuscus TaxID=191477 RepID=UPI002FE47469
MVAGVAGVAAVVIPVTMVAKPLNTVLLPLAQELYDYEYDEPEELEKESVKRTGIHPVFSPKSTMYSPPGSCTQSAAGLKLIMGSKNNCNSEDGIKRNLVYKVQQHKRLSTRLLATLLRTYSENIVKEKNDGHSQLHLSGFLPLGIGMDSMKEVIQQLEQSNKSYVTRFILSGITSNPKLQLPLFLLCLLVYTITLMGNITIITLIRITPHLHTPMYFFLINLSLVDIFYSTTVTPNSLANIISADKTISIIGCAVQMFFFIGLATSEAMLLAVMAYDRYAAICHPLNYPILINNKRCLQFVCTVYSAGFINSLMHTYCTFRIPLFCSSHVNHFYCDIVPILKLSCQDTFFNDIFLFTSAGSIEVGSLLCILISYTCILLALFKIHSTTGRHKTFSTCASHLTCVSLFYCPALFAYLRSPTSFSVNGDWVVSVFYAVVVPMLNPIIYSLRNKDVKGALKKAMQREPGYYLSNGGFIYLAKIAKSEKLSTDVNQRLVKKALVIQRFNFCSSKTAREDDWGLKRFDAEQGDSANSLLLP